jgi:hypothetical protein
MTPTIKNTGNDANSTPPGRDITWSKVAVAFAQTMSLHMSEWISLKCHWSITTLKGHEDKPVLSVYFHVPGSVLGKKDGEVTLDGTKLIDIVLADLARKNATATEQNATATVSDDAKG